MTASRSSGWRLFRAPVSRYTAVSRQAPHEPDGYDSFFFTAFALAFLFRLRAFLFRLRAFLFRLLSFFSRLLAFFFPLLAFFAWRTAPCLCRFCLFPAHRLCAVWQGPLKRNASHRFRMPRILPGRRQQRSMQCSCTPAAMRWPLFLHSAAKANAFSHVILHPFTGEQTRVLCRY